MKVRGIITVCIFLVCFFQSHAQNALCTTGYASYYHDWFDGKLTANGEVMSQKKLTCAHRYLPFGTKLKVTNVENGKSIIVTVNDRGPYVSGRILDLTKAAAHKLDFVSKGQALVRLEIISSEPNTDSLFVTADTIRPFYRIESMDTGVSGYSVKIASYFSETKTYEVIRALKQELGNEVFLQTVERNNAIMYRIFAGKFNTRDEAEQIRAKLLENHPDCYIVSLATFKGTRPK